MVGEMRIFVSSPLVPLTHAEAEPVSRIEPLPDGRYSFELAATPELRDKIEYACYERGLIILGCGNNSIRWSPPLILTKENVDVALQIFDEVIADSI